MLRFLLSLCLVALAFSLPAQFGNPISWSFSHEHIEGDEFNLIATSTAEDGFSVYSQFTPEGGPVPTLFDWTAGDHYELIGKTQEDGHKKSGMDDLFGVEVIKFLSDEPVTWTQRVKVKDYGQPIELMVEWMCCDDEQCLPPTDEVHSFVLAPPGPAGGAVEPESKLEDAVASSEPQTAPPSAAPQPRPAQEPNPAPAPAPKSVETKPEPSPRSAPIIPSDAPTYAITRTAPTEEQPLTWGVTATDAGQDHYRIELTGELLAGWGTYSKDVDPDVGPIPNTFFIEATDGVEPLGEVTETAAQLKVAYDAAWDAEVAKVTGGELTYAQTVRAVAGSVVNGFLEFQVCDDEMCLPPTEVPFQLDLTGAEPVLSLDGLTADATPPDPATSVADNRPDAAQLGLPVTFDPDPVGACSVGTADTSGQGLWSIFGLGLLGGLFALIMPCIFPMIPLTVSFFTKSGGSRAAGIRRAGLYGFFIFLIYVLLSVPFHLLDGLDPSILNTIASSVWLNLIFFVVFLFFAGSFFGFYELTLPESWSNRASRAEGTGGILGIFFMALTLALVSFSCTGPILGSLLVEAVSGGAWPLTAGMAGFGVALGLPFALFAAFPGFLNSMPKSGGWLNSVKVVLGFVEVALAFKFLSTADLVGDWNLLRIEPFLLVWILCALGIAAYLFRLISFPLDSKKRKTGPVAAVIGLASLAFAVYLGVGLTQSDATGTYESRAVLSGIAPPVCYNYFLPCDEERNIIPFKDLEAGLAHAKEVGKPVMLDFTGDACVNCRKMEEYVWTEDGVKRYLTDEFVVVSLYVDDRKPLPEAEQREVDRMDGTGRKRLINSVGKKWQYFQQAVYGKASQPYYVLVSPNGETLNPPVAYTADAQEYENFLACGLATYREMSK